jgi:hypothetical protein
VSPSEEVFDARPDVLIAPRRVLGGIHRADPQEPLPADRTPADRRLEEVPPCMGGTPRKHFEVSR